jgi:hypothetical protein
MVLQLGLRRDDVGRSGSELLGMCLDDGGPQASQVCLVGGSALLSFEGLLAPQ